MDLSQIERKKVVHLVTDEKFINNVIKLIKWYPGNNKHEFIYIKLFNNKLKFICELSEVKVFTLKELYKYINRELPSAIILHNFLSAPLKFIQKIPSNIKVFWFSWGLDLYNFPSKKPLICIQKYHLKTLEYIKNSSNKYLHINFKPSYFLKYYRKLAIKRRNIIQFGINETKNYHKAISRVDYFSSVIDTEFEDLKVYPFFRAEKVKFTYGLPIVIEDLSSIKFSGNSILIGNSASLSNNHLDILSILKEKNILNKKIYMPLSYAGNKVYIDNVIKKGLKILNKNFNPLTEFISFEDYTEILKDCKVGIFMNERQEGMGNINYLLRQGSKVFLSETSQIYKWYKTNGVKVFSIQNDLTDEAIDVELTEEEKNSNRKIIIKNLTKDSFKKQLDIIYSKI